MEVQRQQAAHQAMVKERGSLLAALAGKEGEMGALATAKAHLENTVASLSDQLREKEEDDQAHVRVCMCVRACVRTCVRMCVCVSPTLPPFRWRPWRVS